MAHSVIADAQNCSTAFARWRQRARPTIHSSLRPPNLPPQTVSRLSRLIFFQIHVRYQRTDWLTETQTNRPTEHTQNSTSKNNKILVLGQKGRNIHWPRLVLPCDESIWVSKPLRWDRQTDNRTDTRPMPYTYCYRCSQHSNKLLQ